MSFKINIKNKSFINKHDKKKVEVLKNIKIEIQSNEFVCIVGPSGCGKTTLMNMIGGLIPYDNNEEIEKNLGKKAKRNLMPLQMGDVKKTISNIKK